MEKGVNQHWTPADEAHYNSLLGDSQTFAGRHLLMLLRDVQKYDLRTKAGRRAVAQGKLRLATATDDELTELATLEAELFSKDKLLSTATAERLESLKQTRAHIRKQGIKKGELVCGDTSRLTR